MQRYFFKSDDYKKNLKANETYFKTMLLLGLRAFRFKLFECLLLKLYRL